VLEIRQTLSTPERLRSTRRAGMGRLTNNFLFKDRCALPDQMSFVLTFPWRAFVFAMRNRDCTNQDEISILVLSVTTKDFPHDMLPRLTGSMLPRRCFPPHRKRKPTRRVCAFFNRILCSGSNLSAASIFQPPCIECLRSP